MSSNAKDAKTAHGRSIAQVGLPEDGCRRPKVVQRLPPVAEREKAADEDDDTGGRSQQAQHVQPRDGAQQAEQRTGILDGPACDVQPERTRRPSAVPTFRPSSILPGEAPVNASIRL